jgi:hypothetical protein
MRNFEIEDDDENVVDGVVQDGGRVRVKMAMMDALQAAVSSRAPIFNAARHRPGFRDARAARDFRAGARMVYLKQLTDAWRRDAEPDIGSPNNGGSRAAYLAQLSNAWRTPPGTNPNAATAIERQAEAWRHGR